MHHVKINIDSILWCQSFEVFSSYQNGLECVLQISLICQKLKNNMTQSAFIGNCYKTNWICLIYQTLFKFWAKIINQKQISKVIYYTPGEEKHWIWYSWQNVKLWVNCKCWPHIYLVGSHQVGLWSAAAIGHVTKLPANRNEYCHKIAQIKKWKW